MPSIDRCKYSVNKTLRMDVAAKNEGLLRFIFAIS